ncbi:enoyl-CoA hydratase/isomerase family protein [Profundibacter amoris]|uniref:3-hydroxyisobutyryl-CoA hydrolase n=1 Tax=Profundibacter amoris TaxID=2171755 RepID=A0A347UHC3_9RHOB|nr:enoyl-CoA hydratase/isomerase family protein [Profundibacter amoris]AXX98251.1 enoyl-CoA hydratase/isomerase family protein [Profundibacter amoris]
MAEIDIRKDGKLGRITLNRPEALNALTYEMCLAIEKALDAWREDDDVKMLLIDAAGDRAFCAGGDIAEMYASGKRGDYEYGRRFWRDEYRMNAKLFEFPKPVASLMQGFTMGGGVGVGCHGSHRIVGESSQIAMPECGIGLVPDVGGSLILARAPGRLGEYIGTTGARLGADDAIYAGFADYYIPESDWPALTSALVESGDWELIDQAAQTPTEGRLKGQEAEINKHFGGETLGDILRSLQTEDSDFTSAAMRSLGRNAPLSMGCTVEIVHRLRGADDIRRALDLEYRFTYRSMEHADFIEGIRAAIIDKDRKPVWKHILGAPIDADVTKMLLPLGADALKL